MAQIRPNKIWINCKVSHLPSPHHRPLFWVLSTYFLQHSPFVKMTSISFYIGKPFHFCHFLDLETGKCPKWYFLRQQRKVSIGVLWKVNDSSFEVFRDCVRLKVVSRHNQQIQDGLQNDSRDNWWITGQFKSQVICAPQPATLLTLSPSQITTETSWNAPLVLQTILGNGLSQTSLSNSDDAKERVSCFRQGALFELYSLMMLRVQLKKIWEQENWPFDLKEFFIKTMRLCSMHILL